MELIRIAMRKDLENDKSLMSKWATVAGLKNPNPLYDFLNHDGKTFNEFSSLVNIVKSQYPERENELMKDYCAHLDPNTKAARSALEYADANKFYEIEDRLINLMIKSSNNKSKEYGKVYEIHRELTQGNINEFEATKRLGRLNIKTTEMNNFARISLLYHYLESGNFAPMDRLIKQVDLSEVKENLFLKSLYQTRVFVLQSNIKLNENKLSECREYAKKAIDSTNIQRFQVFSYLTAGNSLLFSDYNQAKEFFLKGLSASTDNYIYKRILGQALCFLNNVWEKENDFLNTDSKEIIDFQEYAHMLINKKNTEKAKEILEQLDHLEHNDNELAMHYYLKGKLKMDKQCFYSSIEYFKKSNDKFLIRLPLIMLKQLGENEQLLNLLAL
ncbi:AimR family lysis-lysogeny pheromone receptor [Bacillus velezensis]|uniref:AimR family lysis-lysogeny pheromone receptor n=1 Tax=Bacillus velezensis TaxID=492670 RepID=UPI002DB8A02E|nr:AimR family lysis-lysogeny pheromone receptor [Bacillus velezensis]MEC3668330.1 AimR family lysis-lysogeny pheromone receptor [Bacillus velezensis]